MKKFIFDERNTMLRDGKLYDLVVSKTVECCEFCAFNHMGGFCPGQCKSKNGDGYWVEAK